MSEAQPTENFTYEKKSLGSGFLPFSAPLRPSPDPRTPPDLSRPLRGPYESPRHNPRVQANDGANPYGGVRPLAVPHIQ